MRDLIKHIQEADVFKPAPAEELEQRRNTKRDYYIVELRGIEPFLAIHPLGLTTQDDASEHAEHLCSTDSSWIVVEKESVKDFIQKLNNLNIQ